MEYLYIVDENDNVLDSKPRHEVTSEDRCRIVLLWVTNEKGEVLLAKRSNTKKTFPGLWSYAVTGAVSHPESYEQAVIREMEEELGIRNVEPILHIKMNRDFSQGKCIAQTFRVEIPSSYELVPDPEEVSGIMWVEVPKLLEIIKERPEEFVHNLDDEIKHFLD